MKHKTTIEINGVDYQAEPARIRQAFLGIEDRGNLIAYLTFAGPGWSQAEPLRTRTDRDFKAYFESVMATLKISDWNSAVGEDVFVLRESPLSDIIGFTHRLEDRYMFFDPDLTGGIASGGEAEL